MKKGDKVTIYEDPFTKQKPEGIAVLELKLSVLNSGSETWRVRFENGDVVERLIENPLIHSLKGTWSTREVWLDGKQLSPARSQALRNHSPDGFNWGYGGSGPAQFALAVLLEITSEALAIREYQNFKWAFIAHLPDTDFETSFKYPAENKSSIPRWHIFNC